MTATSALAAGTPSWELLAFHGPTNVPVKQPLAQHAAIVVSGEGGGAPNEGRFTLEIALHEKNAVTKPIPFDASAAVVKSEIEMARVLGENGKKTKETLLPKESVQASGGRSAKGESEWAYNVSFVGPLAGQNVEISVESAPPTIKEKEEVRKAKEEEELAFYETEVLEAGQRDEVVYVLTPINKGGVKTNQAEPIRLKDTLPAGMTTARVRAESEVREAGEAWKCTPEGEIEGSSTVECTSTQIINPDSPATGTKEVNSIEIAALVDPKKAEEDEKSGTPLVNVATLEGGGAKQVEALDAATVSDTPAPFGVYGFKAHSTGVNGEEFTVAGGHPYAATTSFGINTRSVLNPGKGEGGEEEIFTSDNLKDSSVELPEGFIGNPTALRNSAGEVTRCGQAEFVEGLQEGPGKGAGGCKSSAQVGIALLYTGTLVGHSGERQPVYDLVPPPGVAAEFGLYAGTAKVPIRLDAHVLRIGGKYQVTLLSPDVNQALDVNGIWLSLWGTVGDESHNAERDRPNHHERGEAWTGEVRPFLTNPTDCLTQSEAPPVTIMRYDSWENPAPEEEAGALFSASQWLETRATASAVSGCQALEFKPRIAYAPSYGEGSSGTYQASAAAGYELELEIPQSEATGTLGTPELKSTTVTLPQGIVISPSAANGLQACELAQLEVESTLRGHCPEAAQIGEVRIQTPLLTEELTGRVYIAKPECEPCGAADAGSGKLLKLFIEAEGSGVRVKLPGAGTVNTETGQLTTTFENNPQTPFNRLVLTVKGGPDASLANPQLCGSYTTSAQLTPWSAGGTTASGREILGDMPASITSEAFSVTWETSGGECPSTLPFAPTFTSGTENSSAGAYTNFDTIFKRGDDREQDFAGITVTTPPGLLGKLAGITRCSEPAAREGTCPESSLIGTATAVAGSGGGYAVGGGRVYITNEIFPGAPFGLSIAIPAKAGPFNLGTEVVRAGIHIDPVTSAITITTEPLKQARDGIPFRLKEVDTYINRPEFILNASNCEKKEIVAVATGASAKAGEAAGSATREAPYTASNCAALKFDPQLSASTDGETSKKLGASLTVKVTARPGEANIRKVEVQLPEALPTEQETLTKACTDAQFASNPAGCPEGSVVGSATAKTPLLNSPLTGPVYLVSHGNAAFPDLEFVLQGEGVKVVLDGKTDVKHGIIYSKFETVPDAPVTSFETVLPEKEHSILGAYGVLCEKELIAPTTIVAQNGREIHQQTKIAVTNCPPSVQITATRRSGRALTVTLKSNATGTVTVTGSGVRTTRASLSSGVHTIRVALSKSGLAARRKHKRIKLTATIAVNGHTASRSTSVRA